jgi:uncharacterized cofD-like protein
MIRMIRSAVRWLLPGMHVKRWLLLLAFGVAVLSLGLYVLMRELYPLPRFFYYFTLQFIPRGLRVALLGGAGLVAVGLGLVGFNRALLEPFVKLDAERVAESVYFFRQRERGPKVVAIGGGHGLAVLLRGLKQHTSNITAIVTVADDGGSSGQLRRELGVLPPGDFRNCIAALADDEDLMTQLFQYRFGTAGGLNGHSLGNLFISAMGGITGSSERAILESARVLKIRGSVLPSTLEDVTLTADLYDESNGHVWVDGESRIPEVSGRIERVYLRSDAQAYPGSVKALLEAELIVAGPGSLYTSIIPNLLVREIAEATATSRAKRVFVCNVATQLGETEGYDAGDHVRALQTHAGSGLFPIILANNNQAPFDAPPGVELVQHTFPSEVAYTVVTSDLIDLEHPWRHDSTKLSRALLNLL